VDSSDTRRDAWRLRRRSSVILGVGRYTRPDMLAAEHRVLIALGYAGLGAFLLRFAYFTPWYPFCWIWYACLFGWAASGIAFDPFRFIPVRPASSIEPSAVARILRRWPVLFLSLLVISPLIAWATHFWWFFPRLPWWSLAPYWIVREIVIGVLFVVLVRIVWSILSLGRQFCILLAFLLTSHLVLLLTYAGIAGGPGYLRGGETQDCFLMQLWFKMMVGLLVFIAMEIWSRRRHPGQQSDSANASQPICSETDSTSSTTGSRR